MRILIVSQYFAPERTASSLRLDPLARGLAAAGHEVEVLAQVPSHPEGVVHPGYGRGWILRRSRDGFSIVHLRTWASTSKRAPHRIGSYASYALAAGVLGSLRRKPDVIFASSPPLPVGLVGATLAARYRVPWVFDVRDLWPEVAVALGEVRRPNVVKLLRRLELYLYRSAAAITVPTEAFRTTIHARVPDAEIELLPNGTTRAWIDAGREPPTKEALGLASGSFLWTYAGNVGLSQDLETAVAAADQLGDGYELLILGHGASRPRLELLAKRLCRARVQFRDAVPPDVAAEFMAASDALLVPLSDNPTLEKTVPVKLYDACAVGRPVILAAAGESRSLAARYGAAEWVPPSDPGALVAALRRVATSEPLRQRLVEGGQRLAVESLREDQVAVLDNLLRSVAGQAGQ